MQHPGYGGLTLRDLNEGDDLRRELPGEIQLMVGRSPCLLEKLGGWETTRVDL